MKKLNFLFLLVVFNFNLVCYSQYSNYYKVDVNTKSEVNVKGKVEVNQKVETIDYGAMALAEAKAEENRLKSKVYANETQKEYAKQIASNPIYAFDYGYNVTFNQFPFTSSESHGFDRGVSRQYAKPFGYNYFKMTFKRPNEALYVASDDLSFINESIDGVKTKLNIFVPESILTTSEMANLKNKDFEIKKQYYEPFFGETEKWINETYDLGVGLKNEKTSDEYFLHKSEIKKAIVFGREGFVLTRFGESKYEKFIKEHYIVMSKDGIWYQINVEYKGDSDVIDFKQLESRRAYLGQLNRKIISSAYFGNFKLNND